jgi:plasmid stabilization system protein ParE
VVKYKVAWSVEARLDLFEILEFYIQRNGNANYSRRLNTKVNKSIKLITRNPFLGLQTDIESVRSLVTGDYQIIYEILESTLVIVMVWDCRRNPEDKILNQRTKK